MAILFPEREQMGKSLWEYGGGWGVQTHAHKQGSDHLVPLAAVPSELHPVDRDTAAWADVWAPPGLSSL